MRLSTIRSACLFLAVLAAVPALGQESGEQSGARTLFGGNGTIVRPLTKPPGGPTSGPPTERRPPPPAVKLPGVHYWLDLDELGAVSEHHTFTTGDRIRLHVRTNVDGYLIVWALSEQTGPAVLLPSTGETSGIAVTAGMPYVSPPIRFRPPARDEQLLLFFARQRSQLPSAETIEGNAAAAAFRGAGARDLVVETDDATEGQIGTYVVNRRGGPVLQEIRLRHLAP